MADGGNFIGLRAMNQGKDVRLRMRFNRRTTVFWLTYISADGLRYLLRYTHDN